MNFEDFDTENFSAEYFEDQILFFLRSGYQITPFRQLLDFVDDENKKLTQKPLFITFDISSLKQIEVISPVLEKYNLSVLIFLKGNLFKNLKQPFENSELSNSLILKSLNKNTFTIGLSSDSVTPFNQLNINEINIELDDIIQKFTESNLIVLPILKYPFGIIPEDSKTLFLMKEKMKELGIKYGLKTSRKLNKVPIDDSFELQFNPIQITNTLEVLKLKLKGKSNVEG